MVELVYPKTVPVERKYTSRASDVWRPSYPLRNGERLLYVFYNGVNGRVHYVGKTTIGRPRLRWHIGGNTFIPEEITDDLMLDVLVLGRELADEFTYVTLEIYERELIAAFMPTHNVNVKKTLRHKAQATKEKS